MNINSAGASASITMSGSALVNARARGRRRRLLVWLASLGVALLATISAMWLSLSAVLPALFVMHAAESYWYGLPEGERSTQLYDWLTGIAAAIPPLLTAIVFLLWSRPVLRGERSVRRYVLLTAVGASLLSFTWYVVGWSYGLRHQGLSWVATHAALTVTGVAALAFIALRARRSATIGWSLAFNVLLFTWILTVAFPWLGETF